MNQPARTTTAMECGTAALRPVRLQCNDMTDPIGVDRLPALLSWQLEGEGFNRNQTALQICAVDVVSGKSLWDSGVVHSNSTRQIPYGGPDLRSHEAVRWQVRVWDETGACGPWSEVALFEAGLLDEADWKAQWIGTPKGGTDVNHPVPAPLFRKEIPLKGAVAAVRAYVCGLGYHELSVNGKKADDTVLRSAYTRYDKTVLYDTYDLTGAFATALVSSSDQPTAVVGVMLGNGWYNCFTPEVWDYRQAPWRHQPKLLLQLHIRYHDGSEEMVCSDSSWRTADGPIRFDGLRNGDTYDARFEVPGWDGPGFDDRAWTGSRLVRSPGGVLKSFQMPPLRVVRTLKPVAVNRIGDHAHVFDLGQNLSGWARIRATGAAGTELVLRYSEKIHPDGSPDRSNIDIFIKEGEFQTDRFILKGSGEPEVFEARFTYHGFRYVEVVGYPGTPDLETLTGCVVHTDLPARGRFACSDPVIQAIHEAAGIATLTNWHGIPTDCPHREKNGWTGDAGLSAEQVLYNHDARAAYAKWLDDFVDVQRPSGQLPGIVPTGGWGFNWGSGPAWDSAFIHIVWYLYLYDGDLDIVRRMYPAMRQYLRFAGGMLDNGIADFGLGDWCPPVGGPDDHKCPTKVTDTAYIKVDAELISKMASLLGYWEDAADMASLAETIRQAFCREFVNMETGEVLSDSQTALSCALYQRMVPETLHQKVFERLVAQVEAADRHIDCGILGAKYVMHVLNDMGRADLAHAIAVNPTFPGWGHWIACGATTLRELWNHESSQNHHMFSDIDAWFYRGLAGIQPDETDPGFRHIVIQPNPVPGMAWVEAEHEGPCGRIHVRWGHEPEVPDHCMFTVHIPVNATATFHFPQGYQPMDHGDRVRVLGSGVYAFGAVRG